MLLPAQRQIPLKRDGVLRSAVPGQGRGGRRMDGKSSYCGLGNIDLVINNAMNLKWNSSVSAKAGYFCHKRHITQLENIKRDGEVRGRRRRFLGTCALQREGRGFTSRWGVQGKFSASPNWKTLSETPYKFSEPPHFPTCNCSVSRTAAHWPLPPLRPGPESLVHPSHSFLFSTFLIFIIILLDSGELFSNIMKRRFLVKGMKTFPPCAHKKQTVIHYDSNSCFSAV